MVYHKIDLNPTPGQMDDLSHGTEVKLSHEHLHGDVPFTLTTAQTKKIMKAAQAGKGCTLKLSAAQIKHHAQHGEGRFTDMLRSGYNMLKPVLRKGLAAGVNMGAKYADKKIAHLTGLEQEGGNLWDDIGSFFGAGVAPHVGKRSFPSDRIKGRGLLSDQPMSSNYTNSRMMSDAMAAQRGKGFLGDSARWLGKKGVDAAVSWTGLGIKPKRKAKKHQKGEGWLGDSARWLGHTAVDGVAGLLGGSVAPNQLANHNEGLSAALFQKKSTPARGAGLYQ